MKTSCASLLLIVVSPLAAQPPGKTPINAKDYPALAMRSPFFEKRINASDARIRVQLVVEASQLFHVTDREYVAFFKRMMHDPDVRIRGKAVHKLHDLWVPLDPKELPATFTGFHDNQLLDLKDEKLIPDLIAQCRQGNAEAGWAAYALGLLRCKQAIPDLVKLGADANCFTQYAAGRALLDCGAKNEAKQIFERLMAQTFEPRDREFHPAGYRRGEIDPHYVALAARAYMELDAKNRPAGLKRLVMLLEELEPSLDVNDRSRLDSTRQILATVTGEYFLSHREAKTWLDKHGRGEKN